MGTLEQAVVESFNKGYALALKQIREVADEALLKASTPEMTLYAQGVAAVVDAMATLLETRVMEKRA